jgi:hypothetical protein
MTTQPGQSAGFTINNDYVAAGLFFKSNVAGGASQYFQVADDSNEGAKINAYKTRGNINTTTQTFYGEAVFDFVAVPQSTNNNAVSTTFGFMTDHKQATSGTRGASTALKIQQRRQDRLGRPTDALWYDSTGSLQIGSGNVDINRHQFRNQGDTVIGNGGDLEHISFKDTQARLLFDRSNVSSTANVASNIFRWCSGVTINALGIAAGQFGKPTDTTAGDPVYISTGMFGELTNGDQWIPDGTAITIRGAVTDATPGFVDKGHASNTVGQTYYVEKFSYPDSVSIYNGNANENTIEYKLYTDSALTTPLLWSDLGDQTGSTFVFGGNYGGFIEWQGQAAQGNVYVDTFTTTGVGTGNKFQVDRKNGNYVSVGYASTTAGFLTPYTNAGTGHVVGDTITIDGADLKGITGTNNLTFTVDSVDGSGGITSIGNITGTAYQITDQEWSFEMDQTTDNLYVKDDGVTKFTFTPNGVALKQFNETVVALGNQSGNVSANIDAVNGSIFTMTAVDTITINSIPNAQPGSSYTLKITQDGTGSRTLSSSFKYLGGNATLSTGAGNIDVISVVYDGTDYLASLSHDYK